MPGRAHNIVLVHAVAADPDRADQLAVAIERKAARENRDAVRESRVRREGGIQDELRERGANKAGELFLESVVGAGILDIEAGRINCLREKSDGARRESERIGGKANGGAPFLHRHVPTEEGRLARAKRAEHRRH